MGGFSAIQSKLNSEDIELGVSSLSVSRLLSFHYSTHVEPITLLLAAFLPLLWYWSNSESPGEMLSDWRSDEVVRESPD